MPAIFEWDHRVREEEIDGLGHVNNLAYLRWMQDAAVAHAAAQGWPTQRHHDLGAGWVVRSHRIEYLRPAYVNQRVLVRTWVAGFRKITSLRKYKIVRPADDELLATAETNWAFVNFERLFPQRIPPDILESFEIVTAANEP
jgi:acyl-CoA thioester hydrolase